MPSLIVEQTSPASIINSPKKNHLPLTRLATPMLIHNTNLSENKQGIIKHACRLFLNIEGIIHDVTFHVMSCGKENLILGLPWLQTVSPKIDWHEKTISIPESTNQSKFLHNLYTHDTDRHHQRLPKSPTPQPCEVMVNRVLDHHLFSYLHHESKNQFLKRALDNQAIFHLLCCGNRFILNHSPIITKLTTATELAAATEQLKPKVTLPPEYE